MNINERALDNFITNALKEDIGEGDHTSLACIPETAIEKARLLVKENGVLAGVGLAQKIFHKADPGIKVKIFLKDGTHVKKGDVAFTVKGKARSILKAERVVLNFMQRMSGIATATNAMVREVRGTKAKILDTRKTTPGLRMIEKSAVRIGGGVNHRHGLYDKIMIKDNHIDIAGGIRNAVSGVRNYLSSGGAGKKLKIAIEARNLKEVKEIIQTGGIDLIMLDNFSIANAKKAVKLINGKFEIEATGGITKKNVRKYAKCNVDYISAGALTHSVKSLDLALKKY